MPNYFKIVGFITPVELTEAIIGGSGEDGPGNAAEQYVAKYLNIPIEHVTEISKEEYEKLTGVLSKNNKKDCMFENYNSKISEGITFIIEEENDAWEYYHNYYFVTETGKLYKCRAGEEQLSKKDKDQINNAVKQLDAIFIKEVSLEELNIMLENSKKIRLDSTGYCTGVGFDAGNVYLYAFNGNITKRPIMIGQRGNTNIHSKNKAEEDIALWLEKVFNLSC